jgi:polysaccharide biosynthesis/export protein
MSCNLLCFCKLMTFFLVLNWFVYAQTQVEPVKSSDQIPPNESIKPIQNRDNLIHFGDLIDVDVVGSTEFDWRGTITPEGFLKSSFYNSDPVFALCKSEDEIAQKLSTIYGRLLRNPQVVVKVIDRSNRSLSYIYGAVRTPQRLRIRRLVRLNEIIVLSGGLMERASGMITILRSPNADCEDNTSTETAFLKFSVKDLIAGQTTANPLIKLGDVITVEESEPIYVIGGVNNPKQFLYRDDLTLSRLISMSGGLSKDADPKNVIIYRRSDSGTKLINIDFTKIKLQQFEDVELEKYDIIEIGQNGRFKNRPNPTISKPENSERTINLPLTIIE